MKQGEGIVRGRKTVSTIEIDGDVIEGVDYWNIRQRKKRKRVTFAATSQTEEEAKIAEKGHADGSKPVQVPKRIWRPKMRSEYVEPEDPLDTSGDLDWLFEEGGKSIVKDKKELPPRNDIITYDKDKHEDESSSRRIYNGEIARSD